MNARKILREAGFVAAAIGALLACFGVMWLAEVICPGATGPQGGMPEQQDR